MNPRRFMIRQGFTFCLSLVTANMTVSTVETRPNKTVLLGQNVRPKSGVAYSYPTPILMNDHGQRFFYNKDYRPRHFYWIDHAIFGIGVENFLSYAAHFCKYENENGTLEVVSVGSGDGTIEHDIIAAYANLFGGKLNITLVDPDPRWRVDFQTVDDLIAKRTNAVRNCVLLIIWPSPIKSNAGFDIQAIRKLQPRAVLTMYEITGVSGSLEFLACLHPPGFRYAAGKKCSRRLKYYVIEEIAYQHVIDAPSSLWNYKFRLVKLERTN